MVDNRTVQKMVEDLRQGHNGLLRQSQATATVTEVLKDCRDRSEAVELVTAALQQAILQGYCDVTKSADGKRNDRTSNWKRDLQKCFHAAYPEVSARLRLITSGEGLARTVSVKWVDQSAKTDEDKFKAQLAGILDDCNATEAERASLTSRIVGLYQAEQERQTIAQAEAQTLAVAAKQAALNEINQRAADAITAAGLEVSDATITAYKLAMNL